MPDGRGRPDSRGRLGASSMYENARETDLNSSPAFNEYVDFHKNVTTAAVHPEVIEMNRLGECNDGIVTDKARVPHTNSETAESPLSHSKGENGRTEPVDLPLPHSPPQSPQQQQPLPPPPPPYHEVQTNHQVDEVPPPKPFVHDATPSPSSAPPLNLSLSSPSSPPSSSHLHSYEDDISSREEIDTAAEPLLPKYDKHFPIHRYNHQHHPFESQSDKNLARHLQPSVKRQGSLGSPGYDSDHHENDRLLTNQPKVSHSNTFPKTKVNGVDTVFDSDEDDDLALEVPYEKQLDLHISEEDLNLSKENLASGSFSSVLTASRQASREEPVVRLLPSLSEMRKHQSEEGPAFNILANKSHGLQFQDYTRSRSLDDPPSCEMNHNSPDPARMNSTLAGSPELETYDNIMQQPQLYNHDYAYDPNEGGTPWDEDHRALNLTDEERDLRQRLKDVHDDQPAIPI